MSGQWMPGTLKTQRSQEPTIKPAFKALCSSKNDNFSSLLVLLCHKCRCLFGVAIGAAQHGHLDSVVTRATTSFRRTVAIEFGTWRSGRSGGSSGLVTFV
jgi:hypothetical protein